MYNSWELLKHILQEAQKSTEIEQGGHIGLKTNLAYRESDCSFFQFHVVDKGKTRSKQLVQLCLIIPIANIFDLFLLYHWKCFLRFGGYSPPLQNITSTLNDFLEKSRLKRNRFKLVLECLELLFGNVIQEDCVEKAGKGSGTMTKPKAI